MLITLLAQAASEYGGAHGAVRSIEAFAQDGVQGENLVWIGLAVLVAILVLNRLLDAM